MDNQHRAIKGYRELNTQEIHLMNEIKALGLQLGVFVEKLDGLPASFGEVASQPDGMVTIDRRWLAIARTELQQGLMALTRSIAKPTVF